MHSACEDAAGAVTWGNRRAEMAGRCAPGC